MKLGLWASKGSSLQVALETGKARDLAFLVCGCSHTNTRELFYFEGERLTCQQQQQQKVKMVKTAVCHTSLLRPAELPPANQKPCPNKDTETEAVLLPVAHTFRNFQEEPYSTSPNPRFLKCFSLCHFGLAVAKRHLKPAAVQTWLPQAGTQPWQEAFWLSASLSSGHVLRGVSKSPLRGRHTIQRQISFSLLNLLE